MLPFESVQGADIELIEETLSTWILRVHETAPPFIATLVKCAEVFDPVDAVK
jgi:hypothetical protein